MVRRKTELRIPAGLGGALAIALAAVIIPLIISPALRNALAEGVFPLFLITNPLLAVIIYLMARNFTSIITKPTLVKETIFATVLIFVVNTTIILGRNNLSEAPSLILAALSGIGFIIVTYPIIRLTVDRGN